MQGTLLVAEGGTETVQSVIQQTGETALTDKGLDINLRQAFGEGIAVSAVAAISGPIDYFSEKPKSASELELDEDLQESAVEDSERTGFASDISQQLMEQAELRLKQQYNLNLRRQQRKAQLVCLRLQRIVSLLKRHLTKRSAIVFFHKSNLILQGKKAINVTGIQQSVKKDLPDTKVSQVRDIMAELANRGYLEITQPPTFTNKATGVRYKPAEQIQATQNMVPQLKTPDVAYRRQIDIANEAIEKNNKTMDSLKLDLDSVKQFGRDLQGKRTSEKA